MEFKNYVLFLFCFKQRAESGNCTDTNNEQVTEKVFKSVTSKYRIF